MFMATLLSVFVSCKKQRKGPRGRTDGYHPTTRSSIFYPKPVWSTEPWSVSMSHDRIEANQVAVLV